MSALLPHRTDRATLLARVGPAVGVWLVFLTFSAFRAPVPAVNEPHYLGKAEHFWNPGFAPGDLFLESSNPHLVFYVVLGPLTRWLPGPAVAWIGRLTGLALLAAGWTVLCRVVTGRRSTALPAAAVFLLTAAVGNFSGEWLIGGIESKIFAYGLLFLGLGWQFERRLPAAAAALGAAVAFHPVVGVWGVGGGIAAEAALRWSLRRQRHDAQRADVPRSAGGKVYAGCAILLLLCALPGLVPAVDALRGGDPAASAKATYLQVFVRLAHHLDPTKFSVSSYVLYALLLAGWLGVMGWRRTSDLPAVRHARPAWVVFVLSMVLVAGVGVAVGWHSGSAWTMPHRDLRAWLLKFYPFRLADVVVPLAFAVAVGSLLDDWRRRGAGGRTVAVTGLTIAAVVGALLLPAPDRYPDRLKPAKRADWRAVCRYIREQTPADALVISPPTTWGFRWWARRAEYVNYKDMPQDAASLLEWQRRFGVLHNWSEAVVSRPITAGDLHDLQRLTGADYLVLPREYGPTEVTPVYRNGWYRVFVLPR